jgi:hypothetical protein
MLEFSDFLNEARSRAAEKADRLALVSDNHGGWVDRSGRIVARTVNGDLEFIKKKSPKTDTPEPNTKRLPKTAQYQQKKPGKPAELPAPKPPKEQPPAPEVDKDQLKNVTIVFTRANPPTEGHYKLLKQARDIANGQELRVYPSRKHDPKKNPLDIKTKVRYMELSFPDFKQEIINDKDIITIFDALRLLHDEGFTQVNVVVGETRTSEVERLSSQYNGELYSFEQINVIPAKGTDPDLDNDEPRSASGLRKAAMRDDFYAFRAGLSRKLSFKDAENLFHAVQRAQQGRDGYDVEQPQDNENLRELYYQKQIFNEGDIIESDITGIKGKIIRRGPNYVISVTEDNKMFKSWITDISEWTDVSGVPADQREVGTDALRKYVMGLTKTKKIKNFVKSK